MTPKEKAESLFNEHKSNISYYGQSWKEIDEDAKIHCNITIDEMIKELETIQFEIHEWVEFWKEVKQELEKL